NPARSRASIKLRHVWVPRRLPSTQDLIREKPLAKSGKIASHYTKSQEGMLTLESLAGLAKPEYFFRPHQIGRRLWREVAGRKKEVKIVRLPWGLEITVDIGESIGWSVYTRAIYETAVTEALWRLVKPGDSVVDGGANIGYMTSILAVRVGERGKVYCFEPHPEVFRDLQQNVRTWETNKQCGSFLLYQIALGAREGVEALRVPEFFSTNRGVSWIETGNTHGEGQNLQVRVLALDEVIPEHETIGVVKLDVQGYELAVLKGMERILRDRRVRHVVFEELEDFPAATHEFLREMGYANYGIEPHFRGIRCIRDAQPHCDPVNGPPPNYLATLEPELNVSRLQSGFWQSFGPGQLLGKWF
ncbi:MAG: FkbM family methyltransferase, partial [Candidatus Acidiferrales bacterium]